MESGRMAIRAPNFPRLSRPTHPNLAGLMRGFMDDLPFDGSPTGLLHLARDLRDGDTCEIPLHATLEQVINLLAHSPNGDDTGDRHQRAASLIRSLIHDGRLTSTPSGHVKQVPRLVLMVAGPRTVKTRALTYEPHLLLLSEIDKRRQRFIEAGLWSTLCDALLGSDTVASVAATGETSLNTSLPVQTFIQRARGCYTGKSLIESLHKNRDAKDRKPSPYIAAFNADGTVNEPKFIDIAKSRGEWVENTGKAMQDHIKGVWSSSR